MSGPFSGSLHKLPQTTTKTSPANAKDKVHWSVSTGNRRETSLRRSRRFAGLGEPVSTGPFGPVGWGPSLPQRALIATRHSRTSVGVDTAETPPLTRRRPGLPPSPVGVRRLLHTVDHSSRGRRTGSWDVRPEGTQRTLNHLFPLTSGSPSKSENSSTYVTSLGMSELKTL